MFRQVGLIAAVGLSLMAPAALVAQEPGVGYVVVYGWRPSGTEVRKESRQIYPTLEQARAAEREIRRAHAVTWTRIELISKQPQAWPLMATARAALRPHKRAACAYGPPRLT